MNTRNEPPAMHLLFKLQWLYLFMAIGFNVLSLINNKLGLQEFTSTGPTSGIITMLIIACITYIGTCGYIKSYLVSNTLVFTAVAHKGVATHIVNFYSPEWHNLYLNSIVWFLAVSINIFGVVVSYSNSLYLFKKQFYS